MALTPRPNDSNHKVLYHYPGFPLPSCSFSINDKHEVHISDKNTLLYQRSECGRPIYYPSSTIIQGNPNGPFEHGNTFSLQHLINRELSRSKALQAPQTTAASLEDVLGTMDSRPRILEAIDLAFGYYDNEVEKHRGGEVNYQYLAFVLNKSFIWGLIRDVVSKPKILITYYGPNQRVYEASPFLVFWSNDSINIWARSWKEAPITHELSWKDLRCGTIAIGGASKDEPPAYDNTEKSNK